jgi:histone-lysine N-methyltransferase SETMAR
MTRDEFQYFKHLVQHDVRTNVEIEACVRNVRNGEFGRVPEVDTIRRWYRKMKKGGVSLKQSKPRGRPKKRNLPRMLRAALRKCPDASDKQLAAMCHCAPATAKTYLRYVMNLRKKTARKIPHKLTPSIRKQRVRGAADLRDELMDRAAGGVETVITFDQTWVMLKNGSRVRYVPAGRRRRPVARQEPGGEKVMLTACFSAQRVWGVFALKPGTTMNAQGLLDTVLCPLLKKMRAQQPRGRLRWRLHFDNAPIHHAKIVKAFLAKNGVATLHHPPYSPDLSPCDFFLFGELKKWVRGKHFLSIEHAVSQAASFMMNIDKKKMQRSFEAWPTKCTKVRQSNGAYLH